MKNQETKPSSQEAKQPYSTPQLAEIGSLSQITLNAGGGGGNDGGTSAN